MQENVDKNIERLVEKMMSDTVIESPSFNFTDIVMSQVETLQNNDVTVYKPLISKKGWVFIIIGFCILISYFVFGVETESSSWFSTIDFSVLSNNRVTNAVSSITFPKTVTYSIVLFALMMCIQIPLLKNYFDKRFEV